LKEYSVDYEINKMTNKKVLNLFIILLLDSIYLWWN